MFHPAQDDPCAVVPSSPPPPASEPSTRSPSPRFSKWESFEGEEENAGTPLIPIAESFPSPPLSTRSTNKGKGSGHNPSGMVFASGVSAQFVCTTNPNIAACASKEEPKASPTPKVKASSSSSSFSSSSGVSREPEYGCAAAEPLLSHSTNTTSSSETKNAQASQGQEESSSGPSQFKFHDGQDNIFYSALDDDSSIPRPDTPGNESPEHDGNFFHLNTKSNDISSKCFAALRSSTSKLTGSSYHNLSSLETCFDRNLRRTSSSIVVSSPVVGGKDSDEINPFTSDNTSPPAPSTEDRTVFDKAPLFTKRRMEASKPIPIRPRLLADTGLSSSCPSRAASTFTNPFVSLLQSETNPRQKNQQFLEIGDSRRMGGGRVGSFSGLGSSDLFSLHDCFGDFQQAYSPSPNNNTAASSRSMTPTNYLLAGSSSSSSNNKASTPSTGPHLPFSSNPLTPMTPGSSSSTSNPPTSSSSSQNNSHQSSVANPTQDRYAALKDLDEEFKTQKESESVSSECSGWHSSVVSAGVGLECSFAVL